jgi:predicted nucleic acid-binding protein
MRLVFLDSGPLGLLSNARGKPQPNHCRDWVNDLSAAGVRVFVPETAGYEVRRKLIHLGATAGLGRLDQVKITLDYAPISTEVMLWAAKLRGRARRAGLSTAPPEAFDGDCILAAQALVAYGPGDIVTVATDNAGHLSRYVDARPWETIKG